MAGYRIHFRVFRKRKGITFEQVVEGVSVLFDVDKGYIIGKGRQRDRVHARDLVCYWSVLELGLSITELSKRLDMTLAAVSYAVKRGEKIAKQGGFELEDNII